MKQECPLLSHIEGAGWYSEAGKNGAELQSANLYTINHCVLPNTATRWSRGKEIVNHFILFQIKMGTIFFSISMFSKYGNKMLSAHSSSKRESPLEGFKLQSRALVLVCFSKPRKPQSTYWFLFFSNKKNEATRLFKHCTQFHELFCHNHAFMFYPHNPHNNPLSQWYTAWDIYVCVPWTTMCVSLLGKKSASWDWMHKIRGEFWKLLI